MRIIPVIDLQSGRAVGGPGGRRSLYRPIRSRLAGGLPSDLSDPVDLLNAFRAALRPDIVYLADLDRIEARGDNDPAIGRLLSAAPEIRFWLDGGFAGIETIVGATRNGRIAPVIATETLRTAVFPRPRPSTGSRPILGLDLAPQGVLSRSPEVASVPEEEILKRAASAGFGAAILLCLDRVGTGAGLSRSRLDRLRVTAPGLDLYAGGGIAGLEDLRFLRAAGFAGALLATSLHEGRITPADLRSDRFVAAGG